MSEYERSTSSRAVSEDLSLTREKSLLGCRTRGGTLWGCSRSRQSVSSSHGSRDDSLLMWEKYLLRSRISDRGGNGSYLLAKVFFVAGDTVLRLLVLMLLIICDDVLIGLMLGGLIVGCVVIGVLVPSDLLLVRDTVLGDVVLRVCFLL